MERERLLSAIEHLADEMRDANILRDGAEIVVQVATAGEVDRLFAELGQPVGKVGVREPTTREYTTATPIVTGQHRFYRSARTEVSGLGVLIIGSAEAA